MQLRAYNAAISQMSKALENPIKEETGKYATLGDAYVDSLVNEPLGMGFTDDVVDRNQEIAQLSTNSADDRSGLAGGDESENDATSPIVPIAGGLYYNTETGEYVDNYNYGGNESAANTENGQPQAAQPEAAQTAATEPNALQPASSDEPGPQPGPSPVPQPESQPAPSEEKTPVPQPTPVPADNPADKEEGSFLENIIQTKEDIWDWIAGAGEDISDWTTGAIEDAGGWLEGAVEDVGDTATGVVEDVGDWLTGSEEGDIDSADSGTVRDEGQDNNEDDWKKGWLKPWPKEWKEVEDPGVNNYNIQMYHTAMDEIQTLEEGEMYFVEVSRSYGPAILNGVYGEVILFDQDKYCVYEYVGFGAGKSAIAVEGMSAQGIVKNVYEPEDFQGPFLNGSAVTTAGGISGSIGYDFKDGRPVTSYTQGATSSILGSLGGAFQYFGKKSDGWIYDEAPIRWQEQLWSMPSGNFEYHM